MDTPMSQVAEHQRRALDFMLDALGLERFRDEALRAARGEELEQTVAALVSENRQLRQRVAELEHELSPDEAQLDAWEREVDGRITHERDPAADRI